MIVCGAFVKPSRSWLSDNLSTYIWMYGLLDDGQVNWCLISDFLSRSRESIAVIVVRSAGGSFVKPSRSWLSDDVTTCLWMYGLLDDG